MSPDPAGGAPTLDDAHTKTWTVDAVPSFSKETFLDMLPLGSYLSSVEFFEQTQL